jgi:hypothetical protein
MSVRLGFDGSWRCARASVAAHSVALGLTSMTVGLARYSFMTLHAIVTLADPDLISPTTRSCPARRRRITAYDDAIAFVAFLVVSMPSASTPFADPQVGADLCAPTFSAVALPTSYGSLFRFVEIAGRFFAGEARSVWRRPWNNLTAFASAFFRDAGRRAGGLELSANACSNTPSGSPAISPDLAGRSSSVFRDRL